jgi:hypothetical protein
MFARLLAAGFFGAFVGAWIARALFKWLLDVEGATLAVLVIAFGLVGVIVSVAGERERAR